MAHGVEPRSKDTYGPIPTDHAQLHSWWSRQDNWAQALDLCVKRKRADAMIQAAQYFNEWCGGPWNPSHSTIRWIHSYLCRTPGLMPAQAMGILSPSLVLAGGVGEDGMLRSSLLVEAARADRADIVEWMLQLPFNQDLEPGVWPHVAHIAAANNSVHCLDLAIARVPGVVVHANAKGRTPLHVAAGYGHPLVIAKLLANGADARARDQYGRTPLAALMTGHREVTGWKDSTQSKGWQDMAMMLIREGEGPEQHYGKTARSGSLVERVSREVGPEIARELMNLGQVHRSRVALEADTDIASCGGHTPAIPRL